MPLVQKEVKKVYLGSTLVRPALKVVDFLLVGGGGDGGPYKTYYCGVMHCTSGGGGGGGGFKECFSQFLETGSYCVTVGAANNASCFNGIVAGAFRLDAAWAAWGSSSYCGARLMFL